MPDILIVYYSRNGSVARLARHVARGVGEVDGMQARLRTVPPVAAVTTAAAPPVPDDGAPYVEARDLQECAGLLIGSPTRFGNMAAPLKHWIDGLGGEWASGTLVGKPAGVFTSTGDDARRAGVDAADDDAARCCTTAASSRASRIPSRGSAARARAARPTAPATWRACATMRGPSTRTKPTSPARWAAASRRSRRNWHEGAQRPDAWRSPRWQSSTPRGSACGPSGWPSSCSRYPLLALPRGRAAPCAHRRAGLGHFRAALVQPWRHGGLDAARRTRVRAGCGGAVGGDRAGRQRAGPSLAVRAQGLSPARARPIIRAPDARPDPWTRSASSPPVARSTRSISTTSRTSRSASRRSGASSRNSGSRSAST